MGPSHLADSTTRKAWVLSVEVPKSGETGAGEGMRLPCNDSISENERLTALQPIFVLLKPTLDILGHVYQPLS